MIEPLRDRALSLKSLSEIQLLTNLVEGSRFRCRLEAQRAALGRAREHHMASSTVGWTRQVVLACTRTYDTSLPHKGRSMPVIPHLVPYTIEGSLSGASIDARFHAEFLWHRSSIQQPRPSHVHTACHMASW